VIAAGGAGSRAGITGTGIVGISNWIVGAVGSVETVGIGMADLVVFERGRAF
jgi:hypothetical protein